MRTGQDAVAGFERLTSLFDQAREHALQEGVPLVAWLDSASGIIAQLTPAIGAVRAGPQHRAVLQAALRAKQSHDALSDLLACEVARLSREINQLGAGAQATASYAPRGADPRARVRLDRVG